VALLVVAKGDPLVLMTLGQRFAPAELQSHIYSDSGYDGQFTYYLARYGADALPLLDAPAYRAQRALLPAIVRVLSAGQPGAIVWLLIGINLAALFAGTQWLGRLLVTRGASRWSALGVALSVGFFGAVRMSTNETAAYSLVLGALVLVDRARWVQAALVFALAAIAKEPTLLCAAAIALWLLQQKKFGPAIAVASISVVPWLVLQFVLHNATGSFGFGSGGENTTGFVAIPFAGLTGPIWQGLRLGQVAPMVVLAAFMGVFVVVPVVWSIWQLLRRALSSTAWSPEAWLLLFNVAVIPFTPASTFAEPLGMLRFVVGFQIAFVLFAARGNHFAALRTSAFWACSTLLMLVVDWRG